MCWNTTVRAGSKKILNNLISCPPLYVSIKLTFLKDYNGNNAKIIPEYLTFGC